MLILIVNGCIVNTFVDGVISGIPLALLPYKLILKYSGGDVKGCQQRVCFFISYQVAKQALQKERWAFGCDFWGRGDKNKTYIYC